MPWKMVEVEDGVFEKRFYQARNKLAIAARQRWKRERKERAAEERRLEKERQKELQKLKTSRSRARNGCMKHYKNKNTSKQVELIVTQMLTQFVDEMKGRPLLDYQAEDKESRTARKDQLTIINQTIATIRQMRELAANLKDDEADGKVENVQTPENVIMMDEAKDLLRKAGLKSDL